MSHFPLFYLTERSNWACPRCVRKFRHW